MPDNKLHESVFEYVPSKRHLVSASRIIPIRKLAPRLTLVPPQNIPTKERKDGTRHNLRDAAYIREGRNYTFIFHHDRKTLISAWGPAMFLVRVECNSGIRIFVNTAASLERKTNHVYNHGDTSRILLSKRDGGTSHNSLHSISNNLLSSIVSETPQIREYRILFALDKSLLNQFCGSFDESKLMVATLMKNVKDTFVKIGILPRHQIINMMTLGRDLLAPPNELNIRVSGNNAIHSDAAILLDHFRTINISQRYERDATVVLTGYGLQSGTLGAAYIGGACSSDWGWAWMQHSMSNEIVLAHQMAHLLGASYEKDKTMEPAIASSVEHQFIETSKRAMNVFLKNISASNCLKPVGSRDYRDKSKFVISSFYEALRFDARDNKFDQIPSYSTTSFTILLKKLKLAFFNFSFSILCSMERALSMNYSLDSWPMSINGPDTTVDNQIDGGRAFGSSSSSKFKKSGSLETTVRTRSHGCRICYGGSEEEESCMKRFEPCEDDENPRNQPGVVPIASIVTESTRKSRFNNSVIYCTGFEDLFMKSEGDPCNQNHSENYIIATGLVTLLSKSLKRRSNYNDTVIVTGFTVENVRGPNGVDINARPRQLVRISFESRSRKRHQIVEDAILHLNRKYDFGASFDDVKKSTIIDRDGNKFVLLLEFKRNFGAETNSNKNYMTL